MTSQYSKLTLAAISKMLEGDAEEQSTIVQVFQINSTKNGRVSCFISDGNFYTKAYLNDDSVVKPGRDQFTIICIKSHGALKNSIGITNLKHVAKYHEKLGNPIDWASGKQNASQPQYQKQFTIQKMTKSQQKPKLEQKSQVKRQFVPPTAAKDAGKTQQYQSIGSLYVGLNRWTILCRITRKTFKQSQKKGTKILQLQLVDKSKKKIIGTFFREAAQQFNQYLKQGSVYQISKGRLQQGDYNNSKNTNMSPFTLIFDQKSQFNQVSDVNIVAKAQDTAITLGTLFEKKIFNQQFDVVAYVVDVKQQTKLQKQGKQLTVKQIVIADPDNQIMMSVNLWRWRQNFDKDMIGKVAIFNRFILKQHRQSIFLNSGFRSSIVYQHGHSMKKFEGRKLDTTTFKMLSERRQRAQEDSSDFCKNTLQLNQRINRMSDRQVVISLLLVWVNRFAFAKKWCYQACPKCKKAAQKYSKCNNCQLGIEQTDLKFSMGIQISDFYGSIWITAYDELAKKIFADMGNTAARQLQQLSKDQLSDKLQNYAYQPLRLKVITKKDQQGRIRHNAGRMFEIHEQKFAKDNLEQIHQIMKSRH